MTAKHSSFCREYVVDCNATQAAIRAGYAAESAHVQASRLMGRPEILSHIAELRAELAKRTGISVERVLKEYEKLAFSNMQDYIRVAGNGLAYIDLSKLTRDQAAAIAQVDLDEDTLAVVPDEDSEDDLDTVRLVRKVKLKLADKKGALDSIAKHLGMFQEKVEHTGPGGKGPIQVIIRSVLDPKPE